MKRFSHRIGALLAVALSLAALLLLYLAVRGGPRPVEVAAGGEIPPPCAPSRQPPTPPTAAVLQSPEVSPPPLSARPMSYDADRHLSILYDGVLTWEYDGTWHPVTTTHAPQIDWGAVMVYDQARQLTVLGGLRGNYYNETWEYDGADWTQVTPTVPYPTRVYGAMAYDSARSRAVFFGGMWCEKPGCAYYDETREYTGTDWVQITTTHVPAARASLAMAYDSARGVTVLFGGGIAGQAFADTWEYDGADWTQVTPTVSPPARAGHAMVYDAARGVVVLFGGYGEGDTLNDTWEYDGVTWHLVTPTLSPSPRTYHAMTYDAARGVVVLYGGARPTGGSFGDTSEYDGASWSLAVQQGPAIQAVPYPYCSTQRPTDAGTFYIMPIMDVGHKPTYSCRDYDTLCCGCQADGCGGLWCPPSCWDPSAPGHNDDLVELVDMKSDLGAQYSNPNVAVGFSVPIFYMAEIDAGDDYHFDETILRYVLAVAIATGTPILLHLNGQQWAGVSPLTQHLLEGNEANMHTTDPSDINAVPAPCPGTPRVEARISPARTSTWLSPPSTGSCIENSSTTKSGT